VIFRNTGFVDGGGGLIIPCNTGCVVSGVCLTVLVLIPVTILWAERLAEVSAPQSAILQQQLKCVSR